MSSSNSSTSLAMMPQTQHHIQIQDDEENAEEGNEERIGSENRRKLFRAALKGNWQTAEVILQRNPRAVGVEIAEGNKRILHVAVMAKRTAFVKELVNWMSKTDLELKDEDQNTAFQLATISGIVKIARVMWEKNGNLPLIHGNLGISNPLGFFMTFPNKLQITPLHSAALLGHRDMVSYLTPVTPFEHLTSEECIGILVATIQTDMYDVALQILKKIDKTETNLHALVACALPVLARKDWPIPPFRPSYSERLRIFLDRIIWSAVEYIKFMINIKRNKNVGRIQGKAIPLLKQLLEVFPQSEDLKIPELITEASFDAAKFGNVGFLNVLVDKYPDLIWKVNDQNHSIFHIAVQYRQLGVWKLKHEVGAIKDLLLCNKDGSGNNILHLAGRLAPPSQLNVVPGAANQMLRELLWFEEVKENVPRSIINMENAKGQTPRELFNEEHKLLLADATKFMKDTANYCMLVATLIITVVFATAFTVPGGYDSTTGIPVFLKNNNQTDTPFSENNNSTDASKFKSFVISDTLALSFSILAMTLFWSMLISSNDQHFRKSLSWFTAGLHFLYFSMASMIFVFKASFDLMGNMPGEQSFIDDLCDITIVVFCATVILRLRQVKSYFQL